MVHEKHPNSGANKIHVTKVMQYYTDCINNYDILMITNHMTLQYKYYQINTILTDNGMQFSEKKHLFWDDVIISIIYSEKGQHTIYAGYLFRKLKQSSSRLLLLSLINEIIVHSLKGKKYIRI